MERSGEIAKRVSEHQRRSGIGHHETDFWIKKREIVDVGAREFA